MAGDILYWVICISRLGRLCFFLGHDRASYIHLDIYIYRASRAIVVLIFSLSSLVYTSRRIGVVLFVFSRDSSSLLVSILS
jgi:hypothetical protein